MKKKAFIFLGCSIGLQFLYVLWCFLSVFLSGLYGNIFLGVGSTNLRFQYTSLFTVVVPVAILIAQALILILIIMLSGRGSTSCFAEVCGCILFGGGFAILSTILSTVFTRIIAIYGASSLASYSVVSTASSLLGVMQTVSQALFIIGCVIMFIYKKQFVPKFTVNDDFDEE